MTCLTGQRNIFLMRIIRIFITAMSKPMTPPTPAEGCPPQGAGNRTGERVVSSADLLRPGGRLIIEHRGERYALRETRLGKLILTK